MAIENIQGTVSEIIFQNEENGYTVARMNTDEGEVTVTGCLATVKMGETIRVSGEWKSHEMYGLQFKAESFMPATPSSVSGILAYLSSGSIKGIGPKLAEKIVHTFGVETLLVLQTSPEKIMKVDGIGKKKAKKIMESFAQDREIRNIMMQLIPYGIGSTYCLKIYKKYREKAMNIIRENPYRIAQDIPGIGFKTADSIGMKMGIDPLSKGRIEQGIIHSLKNGALSGHSYLPREVMCKKASELLGVCKSAIEMQVYEMAAQQLIHIENGGDDQKVYLFPYYIAESGVCKKLVQIASADIEELEIDIKDRIDSIERKNSISLAKKQREAVEKAAIGGITIITGGPGTGKTTTINSIIELFESEKIKVKLAAPTGRAAKRMSEATSKEAFTIHRLLEVGYSADEEESVFLKDEDEPISCDALIIDEASMIDVILMYNLLKAVKPGTRLVIVGDVDQLPPVGAGNVLSDMIDSGVISTVKLDEVFRQAKESMIVVNAHRINKGDPPVLNKKDKDFFFIEAQGSSKSAQEIAGIVGSRLPAYYGLDPLKDIQVLSPMRKGDAGVGSLNLILQERLNPHSHLKEQDKIGGRVFRVCDKVMQIKNNYDKKWESEDGSEKGQGVFNGDIGYVYHIDKASKILYILFDDVKIAKYEYSETDEIDHSFCTTVHKSQGSEFEAVVMPLVWAPPMLMTRNLLYTGITRAKKLVVLVGEKRYLNEMIKNNRIQERFSSIRQRLEMFFREGILEGD
ncbi:exodeoxyribonuclease V alpha subunit [Peptoclostridium litorale DSM 5388]|uniref:ATP-dependent RecD2 DNA helicase n=1 Tax=Peptoclostridium litorale DSM 5388 TaxID=1121324 RepID=A0A069RCK3_PEPLI|nr:ATP-dependent RecD-like DNA helicase [Peptoclostridium litorale]KDR94751.1 viral (super1) RNA helicase family protein [Peptoclostridium litorale DSM 5388]SIN91876.1 exodeoxyribonuclease V alpha subunit [Peptoclostridium litorale DSM 5388]